MDALEANQRLVSIILPTHNCATYIAETIRSVQAQTYPHWELVICDDGSTDNTAVVVADYLVDPRIRYIPIEKQKSVYRVRNLGIAQSEGELIAFLDADDLYTPNHLENLVNALTQHPEKLWAYDFYSCINELGVSIVNHGVNLVQQADGRLQVPVTSQHTWKNILEGKCVSILQNCLLRRSCYEIVGPFYEEATHAFDTQYIIRLFLEGLDKAYAHPSYGAEYRIHPKSITKNSIHINNLLQSRLKVPDWLFQQPNLPPELYTLKAYLYLLIFLRVARLQLFEGRARQVFGLFRAALGHPHIEKLACALHFFPLLGLACVPRELYRLVFNAAKATVNFYGQLLTRVPRHTATLLSICLAIMLCVVAHAEPPNPQGWSLTFHDEFDGLQLDPDKWHTSYPNNRRTTPTNQEKQWYVDEACQVKDGVLSLVAEKSNLQNYPYQSGMIASWGLFQQTHGYFEMRAKLPKGKGLWPAFWLLPADLSWPPELDIMEYLGDNERAHTIYMTAHYLSGPKREHQGGQYSDLDNPQAFHTYALEWQPNKLTWYVDSIPRFSTTQSIPKTAMYIIANLAVGGNWPGDPDPTTPFPAVMQVDYIRVYAIKHSTSMHTSSLYLPSPVKATRRIERNLADFHFNDPETGSISLHDNTSTIHYCSKRSELCTWHSLIRWP